jgi:Protein of unknown function (DUF2561)
MDRLDTVDRVLLGACAVVWLAVIGVSVAAVVALVDMGSGRAGEAVPDSSTPWGLYVVIGISAAIILASIPLLLRARRAAQQEPPRSPTAPAPARPGNRAPAVEATTEKLRVFGSVAEPADRLPAAERRATSASPYAGELPGDLIDRVWLRFTLSMATAMGAAALAVVTAAYFMGVRHDGSAWAALTLAGIVTVLMPLIPWWQLRLMRS